MRIILGVTGCIAAYKSPEVLRELEQHGGQIRVVMTRHAHQFIGPATFEALSGHPVVGEMFLPEQNADIRHISLARWADLLLVAPATANIVAKFAHGVADDFLSTLFLSITCPAVLAPAMNVEMWRNAATQENIETLRRRGVVIIEPDSGYLACGVLGEGRMPEPEIVAIKALETLEGPAREGRHDFAGTKVLVTAGPTIEDIDPVRFIGNRSSGKMGYALARAARIRGAEVTLISGPTSLDPPEDIDVVQVRTAEEMRKAVLDHSDHVQAVIMAAAVADFAPAQTSARKIRKTGGARVLELRPTPDILAEIGRRGRHQIVVGFAAETEDAIANGAEKLRQKNLDLIVINDVSRRDIGFGADLNEVTIIDRAGTTWTLPVASKEQIAHQILDQVAVLLVDRGVLPVTLET